MREPPIHDLGRQLHRKCSRQRVRGLNLHCIVQRSKTRFIDF